MDRKQNESAELVWRDRLAKFGRSNLTVKQFCRQEGVSDPTFYQWRKRLTKQEGQKVKAVPASRGKRAEASNPFVPVSVPNATFTEVEFPNGVRVRVPATNAEALRVALTTGNEVCREIR